MQALEPHVSNVRIFETKYFSICFVRNLIFRFKIQQHAVFLQKRGSLHTDAWIFFKIK